MKKVNVKKVLKFVLGSSILPLVLIAFVVAIYVSAIRSIKELGIKFRLRDMHIKFNHSTDYGAYFHKGYIEIYLMQFCSFNKEKGIVVVNIPEAIDTVRHELRHAWQHQNGLLKEHRFLDGQMLNRFMANTGKKNVAEQITYLYSWVEVDARTYAAEGKEACSYILSDEELWKLVNRSLSTEEFINIVQHYRHLHIR
jgi:hypothetical protein